LIPNPSSQRHLAELDVMSDFKDSTPIATPMQYKAALLAVRQRMTDVQLKMLQTHCRSEGHSISTKRLADAVGVPTASGYSNYAHLIADVLKYSPEPGAKKPMWLHSLAYVRPGMEEKDNGHCEWIMRPELVETLQSMKWA
jgi:hypothetical protein